jgi:uncharacterized membrane protein
MSARLEPSFTNLAKYSRFCPLLDALSRAKVASMGEMRGSRRPAALLTALAAATIVRFAAAWPRLPETVASHFDARGVPNGFQSRGAFVALAVGSQLLVVAVFALLPAVLHRIPPRWINLPHKDAWLRAGRFDEALDRYAAWSLWFGCATAALLLGVFELAIRANLTRRPMDATLTWGLLGSYLLVTVFAIVRLYRSMRFIHPGAPPP